MQPFEHSEGTFGLGLAIPLALLLNGSGDDTQFVVDVDAGNTFQFVFKGFTRFVGFAFGEQPPFTRSAPFYAGGELIRALNLHMRAKTYMEIREA